MIKFLITIKSGNLENLTTAYNFAIATLNNPNILIKMIFFYQNGSYVLLNTDINTKWNKLINHNNIYAAICTSSYRKRGITIQEPFKSSSIIEFINTCETVDRIIQF